MASNDVEHRSNNPKIQDRPVPGNVGSLPARQPIPFSFRDGVHLPQDYKPTAFPMKVSAPRETQPQADTVVEGMTKVIGKENRRGWKTPRHTAKTDRKRQKAEKWMAKHGHKIKTRR